MRLFRQKTEWGTLLSGFGRPFGIGFDLEGNLLITDMDCHMVIRIDADFEAFQHHDGLWGGWSNSIEVASGCSNERPRRAPRGWNGPHSVVVDSAGQQIVTCYYQPMVVKLAVDGKADVLITGRELTGPATAQMDARGSYLVAEYAQNLILRFEPDGSYHGRLGRDAQRNLLKFDPATGGVLGSSLLGGFDRPHMAKSISDNSIVVADTWNNRLQRFTPSGEFMGWHAGDGGWQAALPNEEGPTLGSINCPVAIDEDTIGRLLVTVWGSNSLMLLDTEGRAFSVSGLPKLNKPYDARFFHAGAIVADTGNGRVLVMDQLNSSDSVGA